ncbi:unnamed protein product [Gongylonema pulchrum]|uniref:Uncharacterized protein n=1 Tax=Gongylonema pulchrum TaxID=637853 RepID=A0A3P7PAF2_9BILA|nr:unnamed protein product [Gongylonema pulchrum]
MASHFGYSVCLLSLSERTLDDDRLNHLLNTPPPYSVVVLEDVDAAFGSRDDPVQSSKAYEGLTRVTFSGLLNAVDGVASADERILFMTTNHIERLDPALIRPGRVDVKQYFGYCTATMFFKAGFAPCISNKSLRGSMFQHFYGSNATTEMATKFRDAAVALGVDISPAQVQGYLLLRKEDPQAACSDISSIVRCK